MVGTNTTYTIDRNGEQIDVVLPPDLIDLLTDAKTGLVSPLAPFEVGQLAKDMGAEKAGLEKGDRITAINGQPINYFQELSELLQANKGKEIALQVRRDGQSQQLTAQINENGLLGFRPVLLLEPSMDRYSFGEAISKGTERAFGIVLVQAKAFSKIAKQEISATKSLSGPIGMLEAYGPTWNWQRFWILTGLLSMILAFMNLLPIPALDGGHVVFLLYEMVSGRAPSQKFLEGAQKVGMLLLLTLMLFVYGNDIFKLLQ